MIKMFFNPSHSYSPLHRGISYSLMVELSPMPKKPRKKEFEVSKDGKLTVYPVLHETKEKGKLKSILKKLIHIRKGR
jgi:hypothetical protein